MLLYLYGDEVGAGVEIERLCILQGKGMRQAALSGMGLEY